MKPIDYENILKELGVWEEFKDEFNKQWNVKIERVLGYYAENEYPFEMVISHVFDWHKTKGGYGFWKKVSKQQRQN